MPGFELPQLPQMPNLPGFSSSKLVPVKLSDLEPVADDVMDHFRLQGFDVQCDRTLDDGWQISVAKGGMFQAVLGMRMALNITIESSKDETLIKAGIGLFGRQVIPVLVARFVFWPVWVTQAWGLIQQSRLDDEAIETAERSLMRRGTTVTVVEPGAEYGAPSTFCTECGARVPAGARFCPGCGAKVADR
jgi:hypothetical protein